MTDELANATPNCTACLTPLEVAGEDDRPYWECATCGAVAIAT